MINDGFDAYLTPNALALAICEYINHDDYLRHHRILEPSAGEGAFVRAARATWPSAQITTIEPRQECCAPLCVSGANCVEMARLLEISPKLIGEQDLIIGNPPFNQAQEHIAFLLDHMGRGAQLAFLLRLNFLGSKKRYAFWRQYPEYGVAPIVPRPGFCTDSGSTDMTEYGLFIWRTPLIDSRPQRLPHLTWRKKSSGR